MSDPFRIAVIGDVHGHWNAADRQWCDAANYDLVMFVGDLANYRNDGREVARDLAKMKKPTLLMPGNHDAVSLPHLAAEAMGALPLLPLLSLEQPMRRRRLAAAAHPVHLCGYCSHALPAGWGKLTLIGARPHSMGGPRLSFAHLLKRLFDVDDLDSSAAKLCALVDAASDDIIFLAHNGPAGLGEARNDIWGCDFKKQPEDFGDPDLSVAIAYARSLGKRVRAVVAGHMHHRLKAGGERQTRQHRQGTEYVNAARVPRIEHQRNAPDRHHHVKLTVTRHTAISEAVVLAL